MNPTTPIQDLAEQWNSARRLYPIYSEMAREFVIETKPCPDLESGLDTPGRESVEQACQWLDEMDERIQVHQLRQYLQTSSLVNPDGMVELLRHHLAKSGRTDAVRDKIDFLLVQYFSQAAPSGLDDNDVGLAYVAQTLSPILGEVEFKTPVWLNALDRVLDAARRCRSLDELLHGGVLAQGRKAKTQAGDLFFLPIALVAFTRFGYLMRRVFFRLMHGDLNAILDGLSELDTKGVAHLDCRRAQFSAEEPITRLRMICQSWKVMFQAEYSSGQPLRMLVDLRAAVEHALGRSPSADSKAGSQGESKKNAAPAPAAKAAGAAGASAVTGHPVPGTNSAAKSAFKPVSQAKHSPPAGDTHEFEVSSAPAWDADAGSQTEEK
jgi:hypothetical protein